MKREEKTCGDCLFYEPADDECGTCTVSDNTVEAAQPECVDHRDKDRDYGYDYK